MGLFSRLTASIHAKSRGPGTGHTGTPDYPGKSYGEIRTEVEKAVEDHELLKGRLLEQISMLDKCIQELDVQAVAAVRECRDDNASAALYHKVLVSRQIEQLRSRIDILGAEQVKLGDTLAKLKLKVQAFLDERKSLEPQLPSEKASMRISDATAGLDEELVVVRYAIGRAAENVADAGKDYETARQLAVHCAESSHDRVIPDQDRVFVAMALDALKADEVKLR